MPSFDTQFHVLFAILAMLWIIGILHRFFVPLSIISGASLLSAISKVAAHCVLAAIPNRPCPQPPPFVVALAGRFDYWVTRVRSPPRDLRSLGVLSPSLLQIVTFIVNLDL